MDDEPPPEEDLISLFDAGRMLVPKRSRRAVYQLAQRGVLQSWRIDGKLWTTEQALRQYASEARGRPQVREGRGHEAELRKRVVALEAVISEQQQEITMLKIRLAEARALSVSTTVTVDDVKEQLQELYGVEADEDVSIPSER